MNDRKPTIAEVIKLAFQDLWALGQFNLNNPDTAKAIIQAANESDSPVIVGVSMTILGAIGLQNLQDLIIDAKKDAQTPLFFHLDRAPDFEFIKTVIDLGFDSVMINPVDIPYDEKIKIIREVVEYSHAREVCVEAQVASQRDDETNDEIRTPANPEEARDFVTKTGIDYLTISLDSSSKSTDGEVDVDIDGIQNIASQIPAFVVVHGGASVPDKLIRMAIQAGVVKINIDHAVRRAISSVFVAKYRSEGYVTDPRQINKQVSEAVKKVVQQKMVLFGSVNKASSFYREILK